MSQGRLKALNLRVGQKIKLSGVNYPNLLFEVEIIGTLDEVVANTHPFICNFFMGERGRRALEAVHAVKAIMAMT